MIAASKIIPLMFLSVGVFLLMQIILPLVSFQLWWLGQKYNDNLLISPGSQDQVLGVSIQISDNFPGFVSSLKRKGVVPYGQFSLTVPKLKIDKVSVEVDSNDLANGLVHLPGSALPGERGNVFVSGHSALSRLFNLKTALFANLKDLKKGDEIIVEANGAKFRYQVTQLKVVDPSDTQVINPPDIQSRYISLMTCVPPGLNFKRLVVLGKMI
mgnify:CR=1 FL=1